MDTLNVEEKLVPLAGANVGVAATDGPLVARLWNQSKVAVMAGAAAGVLLLFPANGPINVTASESLKLPACVQVTPSEE
jgi:hypothetical protein